ncbi:MAG: ubiquinone/menaquinone biosynthesis methyltransferase [Candidatus Omnitrophica bacterium]|nr:ubiquinone/menaquinone biosynthesis methyltransferase [Candidatus Omnitrophota bacterium]
MNSPVLEQNEVERVFDRIAHRYDQFNSLASFGLDRAWRRTLIRRLPGHCDILDLGCGTGVLTSQVSERPGASGRVLGVDISADMLRCARRNQTRVPSPLASTLLRASGADIPVVSASFDRVISAFVLRNVRSQMPRVLDEVFRVLRPHGQVLMLDLGKPGSAWMQNGHRWYLNRVLPRIGRVLTGTQEPFEYLSASILEFMEPEEVVRTMKEVGFCKSGFDAVYGGLVGIYWAEKDR